MGAAKRIFLFIITNVLIITTLSVVMSIFGVNQYITSHGLDYQALLGFSLIWGFGGAFISLAISRIMAKWMMGVKVVPDSVRDPALRQLRKDVHAMARKAGIRNMPQVGVYDSPEVNAFATGPTKNRALVAVSSGLLQRLNLAQVQGVLGHEVAHIANGDMVTMTLVQGVVNAFVIFISRIISYAISMSVREEARFMVQFITTIVFQILLSILGMIVVAWFSRRREFAADSGGAQLAGRDKMIAALEGLSTSTHTLQEGEAASVATLKISGKRGGFLSLFSTHPPLEDRIKALRYGN